MEVLHRQLHADSLRGIIPFAFSLSYLLRPPTWEVETLEIFSCGLEGGVIEKQGSPRGCAHIVHRWAASLAQIDLPSASARFSIGRELRGGET